VLWKHVHEQPIPPSHLNPAITPPIEQVILRALYKDPQQRFPDTMALAQAYTSALHLSQQKKDSPGLPIFEPDAAPIPLKIVDEKLLQAAAPQLAPIVRPRNYHPTLQRAIISLALVAMFIIPLASGFLVGRERGPVSPAFSAQYAAALHKVAAHVSIRSTPIAYPSDGKTIPQHVTPSVLHHKHKHPHHKDGNNNENEIDA
jgi:serine/threonine protein kinase